MKTIGLTGGIGSGKTTVAKIFEVLGVPIYYADDKAKELYVTDQVMKKEIIEAFGEQTYIDNKLNKKHLAKEVFSDSEKLKLLNLIVHPRVKIDFENWKNKHAEATYLIKEAAILIEARGHLECDKIILVTASQEIRIERVMFRDSSTKKEVLDRINKQLSDEEKLKFSDFEIDNSGDKMLIPQIMKIHEELS